MAQQEHSFDVVSKVDMQEVTNAINQTLKEISQRYDFKGSKSTIDLMKDKNEIVVLGDDDFKLKSVIDILQTKFVKRQIPLKALEYGKVEAASGGAARQVITIQEGISTERAKHIVKLIKDTKIKVQAEIQKDQVRVKAKDIDDLQSVIAMLKAQPLDYNIEFINYR